MTSSTRSRWLKALVAVPTAAVMLSLATAPAHAITNGELDGDNHPYVGLMVAQDAAGTPMWRCSGALLSPTLFLTAGHCTDAPTAHVEIWFDADVSAGRPDNGYPFTGEVSGTPYVHPDYNPNAFSLRDLGVVVLHEPFYVDRYASLPQQDQLDALATKRGLQEVTFTAVGYGLQRYGPVFVEQDLVRMYATPHLIQINGALVGDYSLLLSNNAATGGTCFGDSGGPNLIGDSDVVGAVTSFVFTDCEGNSGVFRMDRSWSLDWIYSEFGHLLP
jgi:hypothetical protein